MVPFVFKGFGLPCNVDVIAFVLGGSFRNSFGQETIEHVRKIVPCIQTTEVTYCIFPVDTTYEILKFDIINTVDVVSGNIILGYSSITSVGELDAGVIAKSKPRQ